MTSHPDFSKSHSPESSRQDAHSSIEYDLQLPERLVSAEHYLGLGDRHYHTYLTRANQRELAVAIANYRKALEVEPSLSEGYVKLASALWDKGEINLETAIDYCQLALKFNPESADAHLFHGYFLRKNGDMALALRAFEQAVSQCPWRLPKARIALASTRLKLAASGSEPLTRRLGLSISGLGEFFMGAGCLPFDQKSMQMLGDMFTVDVKTYGAIAVGRTLTNLGCSGLAISFYKNIALSMPEEPLFFHLLGDLHRKQDNPSGAIYYYQRALELDNENINLHKKIARLYTKMKDTPLAIESYQKVMQAGSEDFETFYQLAQLHTSQKEFIRALYYFKESVNRRPEDPYVHSNMAYVMFKLEDYDGAIQEYRHALRHGEDNIWSATVAQTLGTIYHQVKRDLDGAVAMFQTACQLDPKNSDAKAMLADLYFEQGNFQDALDLYYQIRIEEPDNPDCHNFIGYLLWQMDRNEEAIESYETAIRLDPENPIGYNNLGVIYLDEAANPQRALELFDRALSIKPDYTLACFNVGRSQEMMGLLTEAAQSYSRALDLNRENGELTEEEIVERIENLFRV